MTIWMTEDSELDDFLAKYGEYVKDCKSFADKIVSEHNETVCDYRDMRVRKINDAGYAAGSSGSGEVSTTYFIALSPSDEEIYRRLRARPAERGFTSDDVIRPHIEYNQWIRKNKGKYQLFRVCSTTQKHNKFNV